MDGVFQWRGRRTPGLTAQGFWTLVYAPIWSWKPRTLIVVTGQRHGFWTLNQGNLPIFVWKAGYGHALAAGRTVTGSATISGVGRVSARGSIKMSGHCTISSVGTVVVKGRVVVAGRCLIQSVGTLSCISGVDDVNIECVSGTATSPIARKANYVFSD